MSATTVPCAGPAGRNKAGETADAVRCFLRFLLFLLFFLFSLRLFVTSLYFYKDFPSYAVVALAFFAVPAACFLWRPWPSLFWFLALVPLVNGLGPFLRIFPPLPLELGFAGIYCAWFYGLLRRGRALDIRPNPAADILAAVVFLSLLATLHFPTGQSPAWKLLLHNLDLYSPPVSGIWAAQTILHGIFLLRLIENDFPDEARGNAFRIFGIHALTMIAFGLAQLLVYRNKTLGIYWPFEDVHSYGSYLAFLFLYFLCMAQSGRRPRLLIPLCLGLGLLLVLSYSRATWASVAICSLFALFGKSWKKIAAATVVVMCVVWATLLARPRIDAILDACQGSGNTWCATVKSYSNRYFALSDVTQLTKDPSLQDRWALYRKAIAMIRDSRGLGCGVGSFWRLTKIFTIPEHPANHYMENAHNYYLQMAAELGLPGLAAFLAVLWGLFRRRDDTAPDAGLRAIRFGAAGYLVTCLTGHPLILPVQQFLFWFFVAAAVPPAVRDRAQGWPGGRWRLALVSGGLLFSYFLVSRVAVWMVLHPVTPD